MSSSAYNSRRTPQAFTRRRFLAATAGIGGTLLLPACASTAIPAAGLTALPTNRIRPDAAEVVQAETARTPANRHHVKVNLTATAADIDIGGAKLTTWTYDAALPAREIRAWAGDLVTVRLTNRLPDPTSIHWHGVALRNDMDGVPGLTQQAVAPGATFDYAFTVPRPGTYMFHPHVGVQLDRGLYGPLIVDSPDDQGKYDAELVVLLDDWIDGIGRTPEQQFADLQANGMAGMSGMGGMAGMSGVAGMSGMAEMPGMARSDLLGGDAGDVTYPYFLANGRTSNAAHSLRARPGQRIRLRLINIGADTAFRIGVPGAPLTVTHTDGFPVNPVAAEAILLGMGERIDATVTVPATATPLIAIAEGKSGHAHVLLQPGRGTPPDPAAAAKALISRPVTTIDALSADPSVALQARRPDVEHQLTLAGPGERYSWTMNGEVYDPGRGLPVRRGQRVRLTMTNTTTMFHPMHLHGHTFQVVNKATAGPRKDTVMVLPNQTLQVDFDADNPGQWLHHCHNVYHGEAGMMTVISYVP